MIKNLTPRLAEIGRIKIGGLSPEKRTSQGGKEWQAPVKFDHFVITTMNRGKDGNFEKDSDIHQRVGDKPTEIEIVLLYNEEPGKDSLNFRTQYAFYQGKKCVCRGDGERGTEVTNFETGECKEVACPCTRLELDKNPCKPHGVLNCILKAAEIAGGVWKYSTTSWNSVQNILGSLTFLTACTGGKIAGIPLIMKYFKKDTYTPKGDPTKVGVVGLFFKGSPVQMLEAAVSAEKKRLEAGIRMETLALEVRKDYARAMESGPLDQDEIPEFHPSEGAEEAIITQSPVNQTPIQDPPKVSVADVFDKANQTNAANEKPPETTKTAQTPNIFVCLDCGKVSKIMGNLTQCACTGKRVEKCSTEDTANKKSSEITEIKARLADEKKQAEQKLTEQKPQENPPAENPPAGSAAPADKATNVSRILALRSKKGLMTGPFLALVAKTIKRAEGNADKWSDEEAAAILAAMEAK